MVKRPKKIFVAGDSFAALWPKTNRGWPNMLAEKYEITNVAEPGIGEYKIYQQIKNYDLNQFDLVIVSHTSPSRIHTKAHPIHKKGFRKNCDLIYTDLEKRLCFPGSKLDVAKKWFEYFYDDSYQIEIYNLLREKIKSLIAVPYISLSHVDIVSKLTIESTHLDFSAVWNNHRGLINHYDEFGNRYVFETIDKTIGEIYGK